MKPRFETAEDTERCCAYLRSRDSASYTELSQHLGRDVQRRERYILESARRILEREGIVFVTQTGVGLVRAADAQIAQLATNVPIEKIRRTTRRAQTRERIVNVQLLSHEDRTAFYVGSAIVGGISQFARRAFKNKVTEAVNVASEPISLEETLQLFSKLKPNGG